MALTNLGYNFREQNGEKLRLKKQTHMICGNQGGYFL